MNCVLQGLRDSIVLDAAHAQGGVQDVIDQLAAEAEQEVERARERAERDGDAG